MHCPAITKHLPVMVKCGEIKRNCKLVFSNWVFPHRPSVFFAGCVVDARLPGCPSVLQPHSFSKFSHLEKVQSGLLTTWPTALVRKCKMKLSRGPASNASAPFHITRPYSLWCSMVPTVNWLIIAAFICTKCQKNRIYPISRYDIELKRER